jgi:hypothetical protein
MDKKFRNFLGNFPLGLLTGALIAFAASCLVDQEVSKWLHENLASILGSTVALVASTLAVGGVLFNVHSQERHRREERLASLRAAKATLPLALSELHQVCTNRIIQEFLKPSFSEKLDISPEIIGIFKECIEYDAGTAGTRLREIINLYQVLSARSEELRAEPINTNCTNFPRYDKDFSGSVGKDARMLQLKHVIDWLQLRILNDKLFKYARGHFPPDSRDDIRSRVLSAINFLKLPDGNHKLPDGNYLIKFPVVRFIEEGIRNQPDLFQLEFEESSES